MIIQSGLQVGLLKALYNTLIHQRPPSLEQHTGFVASFMNFEIKTPGKNWQRIWTECSVCMESESRSGRHFIPPARGACSWAEAVPGCRRVSSRWTSCLLLWVKHRLKGPAPCENSLPNNLGRQNPAVRCQWVMVLFGTNTQALIKVPSVYMFSSEVGYFVSANVPGVTLSAH